MGAPTVLAPPATADLKPRVGFIGTGWIGRHRMEAMLDAGRIEAAAIADPSPAAAEAARELAPDACLAASFEEMLSLGLDGVVIATPSALHAQQAIQALEAGAAVFCQKPLGRTAAEARAVVDAARANDRLLSVDLSYRFTEAFRRIETEVRAGALGRVYALDLTFHNAYGPDKPWFYDRALSGGGCLIDLGVHLVDLALWLLDFPRVLSTSGALYAKGRRLAPGEDAVEDYAVATLELEGGRTVRIACSWNLDAGCDAVISAEVHGETGGARVSNIGGSFYDFRAERLLGTQRQVLVEPPDPWGGRAGVDWARRLAAGERFDPEAERLVEVARVLDRIYGR